MAFREGPVRAILACGAPPARGAKVFLEATRMSVLMRERIYARYVDAWEEAAAPASIAGLAPRAPTLRALIREHFPADRDAAVLDLGCGHGALLHFAREAGYRRLRGIDVSPQQVAVAHRLGIDGVEEGDLLAALAGLPDASQDVAVAFDVIEHFTKDELVGFVDAVGRVLKPGGRWIIHVPNAESPFGVAVRYGDMTHEQAFTRTSLEQLLRASGFSEVRCFESGPIAHGIKSAIRVGLWKLIRLALRIWVAAETGDAGRRSLFTRNLLAVARK